MPYTQKNDYGPTDDNPEKIIDVLDIQRVGLLQVSLTNYDNDVVPAVASGSKLEAGGAYLEAELELSISTTDPDTGSAVVDGEVYIVVNGTTKENYFTASEPVWDGEKQGFYGTGDLANYRFIGGCTKSGTAYTDKYVLMALNCLGLKVFQNKIAMAFIDQIEISKITIGELNMYAYGDALLISAPAGGSVDFNVLRPCSVYIKTEIGSAPAAAVTFNIYRDSVWNLYCTANGSDTGVRYYPTATPWVFTLTPGVYRLTGYLCIGRLYCISAEGVNELDADKIVEVIS